MKTVKRIVQELRETKIFDIFEEKAKNYYMWYIAVDIFEQTIAIDEIWDRLLCIPVPVFEHRVLEMKDISNLPINKQIEHYHRQGFSVRQIAKRVNKTYTRVKNVVKVLRQKDM